MEPADRIRWRSRWLIWAVVALFLTASLAVTAALAVQFLSPAEEVIPAPPQPEPSLALWTGALRIEIDEGAWEGSRRFVGGAAQGSTAYFVETAASLLVAVSADGSAVARPLRPPRGADLEPPRITDVVALESGRLLVSDIANGSIWRYSTRGAFRGSFLNDAQKAAAELDRPLGLGLDGAGRVAVVDGGDHKLKLFGPGGDLLFMAGGEGTAPGSFNFPNDVAVGQSGLLFVADSNNRRIQALDDRGEFVRAFRSTETTEGLLLPRSLVFDAAGHLHVTDTLAGRVHVYTEQGDHLGQYGDGGGEGRLVYPEGLAVLGDSAFVGDRSLGELIAFRLSP
jgi:DNA-binding beta-propeller fold protein YncE